MKVSDVLARTVEALNDPTYERWSQASQIRYVNDAVLAVLMVRPDANPTSGELTLVAGSLQSLPANGLRLLDISHNVGGAAISYVDREVLDKFMPAWRSSTQTTKIKNWIYDNKFPKEYEVYPPAKVNHKVYGRWSAEPTPLTLVTEDLVLDDVYINPVVEFVLFKAYSIDTEFSLQPAIAGAHLNAFSMMLGQKTSKDLVFSPDLNQRGANPNVSATMGAV
jgi:hypothetical protein